MILDEAHKIKNCYSEIAKSLRKVHANMKFLLTGTPMPNNPEELRALYDFVKPGMLGSQTDFKKKFVGPITSVSAEEEEKTMFSK